MLLALLGFAGLLAGPYLQNWKFQRYIEEFVFSPNGQQQSVETVAAMVANEGARLGLPVRTDQVRVSRSESGTFVEARYVVRVDLTLYTVDLHFRPSAGAR